jgi:hypothetical protein
MTNDQLVIDVGDELFWDPKVDNEAIAVSARRRHRDPAWHGWLVQGEARGEEGR